ncbi:DUF1330 domain-containing protein [Parasedimentitalea marina]|uniref:DUF1330 domain-containing protein n=1 Tax=Parasedimentitalea marina TaxID=2483033 RepID=A0A3T0N458_9RHOB|nr:DUF1330 domain-containing protein [Parasedimentitalea marina]AZV78787.1 DUF1330 domain-containing protein [Parasedimentitalea marina]
MPKGYWVAHVDVDDMDRYQGYITANAAPFADFGARFLIRGGTKEVREGQTRARTVVIEFKDFATAKACYDSVAYQDAKALRDPVSTGDMEIIEGYGG